MTTVAGLFTGGLWLHRRDGLRLCVCISNTDTPHGWNGSQPAGHRVLHNAAAQRAHTHFGSTRAAEHQVFARQQQHVALGRQAHDASYFVHLALGACRASFFARTLHVAHNHEPRQQRVLERPQLLVRKGQQRRGISSCDGVCALRGNRVRLKPQTCNRINTKLLTCRSKKSRSRCCNC